MSSESNLFIGMSLTPDNTSDAGSIPDVAIVRRMVALFDYDPWESSPNVDSDVSQNHDSGLIFYFTPIYCVFSLFVSFNRLSWVSVLETLYMCWEIWTKMGFIM